MVEPYGFNLYQSVSNDRTKCKMRQIKFILFYLCLQQGASRFAFEKHKFHKGLILNKRNNFITNKGKNIYLVNLFNS